MDPVAGSRGRVPVAGSPWQGPCGRVPIYRYIYIYINYGYIYVYTYKNNIFIYYVYIIYMGSVAGSRGRVPWQGPAAGSRGRVPWYIYMDAMYICSGIHMYIYILIYTYI